MTRPRFDTLADWLTWQETLHPKAIDLGLERVRTVANRLGVDKLPNPVISVGGTNGKGSSVAFLAAIYRSAGFSVGTYTSPHILRYAERICLNDQPVEESALCRAFNAIDKARDAISLTYFEWGTLAALLLFHEAKPDVIVLEVGLGGRLDAVNLIDADTALITGIGLDHTDWLGPTRETIGFEKAGIFRPHRPAICADPDPPVRLLNYAEQINAKLYLVDRDYGYTETATGWTFWYGTERHAFPPPTLLGAHQRSNAAAAVMTVKTLHPRLPVSHDALTTGLVNAHLPARFQILRREAEWIFDVAHNPQAAVALANTLAQRPCNGKTHAIVGMLRDKDAQGFAQALAPVVDQWHAVGLPGFRGQSAQQLASAIQAVSVLPIRLHVQVADACQYLPNVIQPFDRIVVCGSFLTVAEALTAVQFP